MVPDAFGLGLATVSDDDSGEIAKFLDTDFLGELGDPPGCVEEVVVLRGSPTNGATSFSAFLDRADEVEPDVAASRADALDAEAVSDLLFTSGTTGAPKGAMLRHGASEVVPETVEASLQLAARVLAGTGMPEDAVEQLRVGGLDGAHGLLDGGADVLRGLPCPLNPLPEFLPPT